MGELERRWNDLDTHHQQDIGPGAAWCETFDSDGKDNGDEEVVIPWADGGAGLFDYSAGSTMWNNFIGSSYFIKFIVKGDYYNRGYDSTLPSSIKLPRLKSGFV